MTYVKWLFSDIDPEELFSTGFESRRITFLGDVGVIVKKDGKGISGIDSQGNTFVPDKPEVFNKGEKDPRFSIREFTYLPAAVMSYELDATRDSFLSLSGAIVYGLGLMNKMGAILVLCLLVSLYHRFMVRRRGHKPYSDWFVIIPHLIFIAVFTALTQNATFYMFTIGKARAQCASATLLIIALLSIMGAIRSKKPSAFVISTILLLLVPLAGTYYNNLPIDSFSILNMMLFFAIVILLSTFAVRSFKRENHDI